MNRLPLLLLLLPGQAFAWGYCGSWAGDHVYDVCMSTTPGVCSGPATDAMFDVMDGWSRLQGSPVYLPQVSATGAIAPFNSHHEAAYMDRTAYQAVYGPISNTALGVTNTTFSGVACTTIVEADVILFTDYTFDLDRASADLSADIYFGETAAHEVGHASSFNHQDGYLTLMNSYDHEPSVLPFPHGNEVDGVLAHASYAAGNYEDYVVLPYRNNAGAFVLRSFTAAGTVKPGDPFTVGDVQIESWGTLGLRTFNLDLVLSRDQVADAGDTLVASGTFFNLGGSTYGSIGTSPLTVPTVSDGTWYVLETVDRAQAVVEEDEDNNTVVMGALHVDTLALAAATPGVAGVANDLVATEATPGARVYYVGGSAAGTFAVPGCATATVGIQAPRLLGSAVADPSGRAVLRVPLPAVLAGRSVKLQAVELASCVVSPVRTQTL